MTVSTIFASEKFKAIVEELLAWAVIAFFVGWAILLGVALS